MDAKAKTACTSPDADQARSRKIRDTSNEIIGMTTSKEANFSQRYQKVDFKTELIDYYTEISDFYILQTWSDDIWNRIRT